MSGATHFYEPRDGHGLAHDPLNAIVAPRPIGWISSLGPDGQPNLAPYSFFNAFNYRPPIIGFSSIGRKDSLRNIEASGEFVWNLVTFDLSAAMNVTSLSAAHGTDEFSLSGLTTAPSRIVAAPRVAESPATFECRCSQIVQLRAADGAALPTWLVLGEVVGVHIDPSLLRDGVFDTTAAQAVMRAGGLGDYYRVTSDAYFHMDRPRKEGFDAAKSKV